MISALLGVLMLGQPAIQQDEARDWEFRGARWETMAPVLSKELGMPVRVLEPIRDEVVAGRFIGKTPEEMMRAFGAMTLTSWSIQQGTVVVGPDGRARAAEEKEALERRTAAIQRSIDKTLGTPYNAENLQKAMESAKSLSEDYQSGTNTYRQTQEFDRMTPGAQLMAAFVKEVGAGEIAKLELGSRTALTTRPSRFQRPLGSMGGPLIELTNRTRKLHQEVFDRLVPEGRHSGPLSIRLLLPSGSGEVDDLLVVMSASENQVRFTFNGYGVDGSQVFNSSHVLLISNDPDYEEEYFSSSREERAEMERLRRPDYRSRLTIDERSKVLGSVLGNVRLTAPLSEEQQTQVLTLLADIESEDPLGWMATDIVFALSKETGRDAGGRIGDEFLYRANLNNRSGGVDGNELLLADALSVTNPALKPSFIETEDGFRFESEHSDSLSLNRKAVAMLARELLEEDALSFEVLAQAALASNSQAEFSSSLRILDGVRAFRAPGSITQAGVGTSEIENKYLTLRVYATLPPTLKSRIKEDAVRLSFSELPPKTRDELFQSLLKSQWPLLPTGIHRVNHGAPEAAAAEAYQALLTKYQWRVQEPTSYLAFEEINPIMVTLSIADSADVIGVFEGGAGIVEGPIAALGRLAARGEAARQQGATRQNLMPISHFVSRDTQIFRIHMDLGGLWDGGAICKISSGRFSGPLSMAELPAKVRDDYRKAYEAGVEEYKDVKFAPTGGGRTIPP